MMVTSAAHGKRRPLLQYLVTPGDRARQSTYVKRGIAVAKTILLTWRNMLADAERAASAQRLAAEEQKEPDSGSSAQAASRPGVTAVSESTKPLAQFVPRMHKKHSANGFEIVYFDSAQDHPGQSVEDYLRAIIPIDPNERVKLYISGHGGIGCDFITDDTEAQRQTVDQLALLLTHVLADRETEAARCSQTQVNMVSCLFARSPDGAANTSPAAKLHRKLMDNHIYVDLVGRTESITSLSDGRNTFRI
jgi:hypothetical protein